MKHELKVVLGCIVGGILCVFAACAIPAFAHSELPAATVWTNGQILTYTALNNTVAHIHNTFTNGLLNVHVNSAAAIAHSKLASPKLIPKVMARVGNGATPCDGALAITVDCNVFGAEEGAHLVYSGAAVGTYRVHFTSAPSTADMAVLVTSHTSQVECQPTTTQIGNTTTTPSIIIVCRTTSANVLTNAVFSFVVYY